jgi:hypothetical protein
LPSIKLVCFLINLQGRNMEHNVGIIFSQNCHLADWYSTIES